MLPFCIKYINFVVPRATLATLIVLYTKDIKCVLSSAARFVACHNCK